ncbi:transcriptional regulator [Gluconobacter thailandicus F149-1 = NBRC 100600]|uniref:GntR family transcriptional regulator n=2 Tax=Gluconobacter thailandicus TaxID=257438 RepID=A0ABQ0IU28_GLUTH|nr:GntR family transcriptional regulator [Gluconobacter thailandicus NBRC 3255]GAD25724.1 GntR family transcriptional regulator [Gluconobacter thailandicus NBRC 3257]GAN93989.1 transcriptional regulator [Gluconobacter thailandicus F149-1 = NBRC 100600]GEL87096.1 GntR family transcriptional regulator [Gluconobacter thailandicus F149-1 = NBRC 100600]
MVMFLPFLDRQSGESLQKQIVRQLAAAISSGTLRPGEPLAGIRECATNWGVSRNTVMLALEHLEAEGYVEKRPSRGTYVHQTPPHSSEAAAETIALAEPDDITGADSVGSRPERTFADQNHSDFSSINLAGQVNLGFGSDQPVYRSLEWKRTIQKLFQYENWKSGGQFQSNAGLPFLRNTLARWLTARHGTAVDERQVIIISGLQQAHSLIAQALLSPEMKVALEAPCYIGKRLLYEKMGMGIVDIPVNGKGVGIAGMDLSDVQLLCVNPGCQVPTNATLSLPRRRQLLALAARNRTPVFEESMFDFLTLDGKSVPSLLSLSGGKTVIHAGLFAPALGGGMMLGYMVVPWPLLPAVLDTKLITDNGLPWLEQEALARFMDAGDLDEFLKRRRMTLMRRRDHLVSAMQHHLGEFRIFNARQAPRISWFLPAGVPDSATYVSKARKLNLQIPGDYPLRSATDPLTTDPASADFRRLISHGYGELAESGIEQAAQLIAQAATASFV